MAAADSIEGIINEVIRVEGDRFTNDPTDPGGPTKYGITLRTLSMWRGRQCTAADVEKLERAEAFKIYQEIYVYQPRYHLIEEVSPRIAAEVVDTGVNMGTGKAGEILQRALNALSDVDEPNLIVDGSVGPATISRLKSYLKKRGKEGEKVLLVALNGLQVTKYIEITERTPSQKRFTYGWLSHRATEQLKGSL